MWKFLWKTSLIFVILPEFCTITFAKESQDRYLWQKLESHRWIGTFLYEFSRLSVLLFYVSISFLTSMYVTNVVSKVWNIGTSPECNPSCRILHSDGEYESVIVTRIFWTFLGSPRRSLFSTIIWLHARPFITSGIFLRLFTAKHANGKSESLKSLFAGRTDVLEWAIATISQVTVSARSRADSRRKDLKSSRSCGCRDRRMGSNREPIVRL